MKGCRWIALIAALVCAAAAGANELEPAPEGLDGRQVAQRAEDAMNSERAFLEAEMTVVSPRLTGPRVVAFRSWEDRPGRRSFIRISSPAKDAGSGFLKLHPNLWMYVPRVERTMRIPPSMMLQSWMGSDFTNDDLVKESSALEDYDHRLLGVDPSPTGHEGLRAFVVEYRPHEDAPVVWGRLVTWVETLHGTPLRTEFYDEDDVMLREMTYSEIESVDGRYYPRLWIMRPLDKEGHETRIRVKEIRFDAEIEDSVFTKRHLTKAR